jgi:hypothetical protein
MVTFGTTLWKGPLIWKCCADTRKFWKDLYFLL